MSQTNELRIEQAPGAISVSRTRLFSRVREWRMLDPGSPPSAQRTFVSLMRRLNFGRATMEGSANAIVS